MNLAVEDGENLPGRMAAPRAIMKAGIWAVCATASSNQSFFLYQFPVRRP